MEDGKFITIEGIEGVGKSTQLDRLVEHIKAKGYKVLRSREPGGTPTGEMITHLDLELPSVDDLGKRIAGATRSEAQYWAEASDITQALLGSSTTSNIFVVGMAVQALLGSTLEAR